MPHIYWYLVCITIVDVIVFDINFLHQQPELSRGGAEPQILLGMICFRLFNPGGERHPKEGGRSCIKNNQSYLRVDAKPYFSSV